jgi:hypothetical protein
MILGFFLFFDELVAPTNTDALDKARMILAAVDSTFFTVLSADPATDFICCVTLINSATNMIDSSKNSAKNADSIITNICAQSTIRSRTFPLVWRSFLHL